MTTYNTRNPLGSSHPKDLYDNSENLDRALNAAGDTWTDRLGVVRPTVAGALKQGTAHSYSTVSVMNADSTKPNGTWAVVVDDADENNGYYQRQSGVWVKTVLQPASVSQMTQLGIKANNALAVASRPKKEVIEFAVQPKRKTQPEFSIIGKDGRSIASFYDNGSWAYPWQREFATKPMDQLLSFAFIDKTTGVIFSAYNSLGEQVIGASTDVNSLSLEREILSPNSWYMDYQKASKLPKIDSYTDAEPRDAVGTTLDMYALIDSLVAEHPDYLTKTVLGQDQLGNDILCIRAVPAGYWTRWYPENAPEALKKPKVILLGGTHGNEKRAAYANYQLIRAMCKNWREDDRLSFLRWGVELVWVPICNPSGWNDSLSGSRNNINGVDINRNYPTGWSFGPTSGPSPASEIETQLMIDLFEQEADACAIIDHHNAGDLREPEPYAFWVGTERGETIEIARVCADKMMAFLRKNFSSVDQSNGKITRIADSFNGTCSKYIQKGIGKNGFTLETGSGIRVGSAANNLMALQIHALEALTTLVHEIVVTEIDRRKRETELPNT